MVKQELRGSRLGVIGGRAISAYPTSADPNQIKMLFGVEVDHIDQLILLEKAKNVTLEQSRIVIDRVCAAYGSVDVPEEMLVRSVNVYIALRDIISTYKLAMLTVKCIGEFMDAYSCCCLAVSMLNDEGFTVVCQGNINALLSAYILSRFSSDPVYFGDISTVGKKDGVVRLINCGSIPGKLAQSYADVAIKTQYEYMGKGRGACTLFCCKEGAVTFGTLGRNDGKYVMSVANGKAFAQPLSVLHEVRDWAQGFIHLEGDPMTFYHNIRSNHCTACYGNHTAVLKEFCWLMDIEMETC